jgi:hypothetical protein
VTSMYILVAGNMAEQATETPGSGGHHWQMEKQPQKC